MFWRSGNGKTIILGMPSQDQRAEQNMVVAYDDSTLLSSDKISAGVRGPLMMFTQSYLKLG